MIFGTLAKREAVASFAVEMSRLCGAGTRLRLSRLTEASQRHLMAVAQVAQLLKAGLTFSSHLAEGCKLSR